MSRIKEEEVREDRILMEIVVDAYNEESVHWDGIITSKTN
jgi:hypothetical protein